MCDFFVALCMIHFLLPNFEVTGHDCSTSSQGSELKIHPCEHSACYPPTGNLLIGREAQLYASSTCGLHNPQRYCIVSHVDEEQKNCFWCDSRPNINSNPMFNHIISNVVHREFPSRQKSWWQSETGKDKVYIQLDLEMEFHFTDLIMKFNTFKPAAMLIERSYDFGQTWQVYRYFANDCAESFPDIREGAPEDLSEIVCESLYSDFDSDTDFDSDSGSGSGFDSDSVEPSTEDKIVYKALHPDILINDPYLVQDMLRITNLRINFTKLNTLGDDLLDSTDEIAEKYYYAITDLVVHGFCSCNGHSYRCLPLPGVEDKPDIVQGMCDCIHNTKGKHCEECEDFFSDVPWRPGFGMEANACKKCKCNNHARNCHFDAALYEATSNVTGGICDGCQHNTVGPNCDKCKPFYYIDPERDIQDPEVCQPCDCDPVGSLNEGICDSVTDSENDLVAGTCHCKSNVMGPRCDTCKNGHWDLTSANPDGCQSCICNALGTIGSQECDQYTGNCTCKKQVTGADCSQCSLQHWGLSDNEDGCQPCRCDPGGAYDNLCDVVTGQCRCRDHMTGPNCDKPQEKHFIASLDYLLYEAEGSRTSGQIVIREPYRDGRPDTWTGTGFVKVYPGGYVEFTIHKIETILCYDIAIRYELVTADDSEDFIVTVERPDNNETDPNNQCVRFNPKDDTKHVSLPARSRSVTVFPPACLESGKMYKIKLEFQRDNNKEDAPSAYILIDSITLLPRINNLPWFKDSAPGELRREDYENHECSNPSYHGRGVNISEACKKYQTSIGAYIFNGAFSCECDPIGSASESCDPIGGFCNCKVNVVGRRCDRCAPGTYGFGSRGCKSCNCNNIGSLDNFCDVTTGQCKCRSSMSGRQCNGCLPGYWGYPHCERCYCNGHTDACDRQTGVCIDCKNNTQGDYCDHCIDHYYGDPRLCTNITCKPCPCPGPPDSNSYFANKCALDPISKAAMCECQMGYSGARCDECSDNYYGNPEVPGGSCQPCECNDNVDLLASGNCDPHTGQCLKCLYETTGDHCEVCRAGFFRFKEDSQCQRCRCTILGTDGLAGPCDPNTGQCHCLPNVSGLGCDRCIPDYWKIASGEGCEACDCDSLTSTSTECDVYTGQCPCHVGFGGRQCNDCRYVRLLWASKNKFSKKQY